MRGFRQEIPLQITVCKEITKDKTKYSPSIYLNSDTQTVLRFVIK